MKWELNYNTRGKGWWEKQTFVVKPVSGETSCWPCGLLSSLSSFYQPTNMYYILSICEALVLGAYGIWKKYPTPKDS